LTIKDYTIFERSRRAINEKLRTLHRFLIAMLQEHIEEFSSIFDLGGVSRRICGIVLNGRKSLAVLPSGCFAIP
jgi:hypothetical protein